MSNSKLDQIVKGAPIAGGLSAVSPLASLATPSDDASFSSSQTLFSARESKTSSLYLSPPYVYVNLLVLEASLRAQYLALRDRRRQNTFFIFLLCLWLATFGYLLFLRPREDGKGLGGSVYWVVETSEKVALMAGIVTAVLVWGTGQWDRGVRWPRRWLSVANRGLRNINAKIVIIKGPWWREMLGYFIFLFPYSALFATYSKNARHELENAKFKRSRDGEDFIENGEDLAPGGDHIKLLLLSKPFSPDFRENWELYRLEYWEKENDRRAKIRFMLRSRDKEAARNTGGWWWFGLPSRKSNDPNSHRQNRRSSHKQIWEKQNSRWHPSVRADVDPHLQSGSSTAILKPQERVSVDVASQGGSITNAMSQRRRVKSSHTGTDAKPAAFSRGRAA